MANEKVEDKVEVKKNTGAGLRGQSAGETEISTVGVGQNSSGVDISANLPVFFVPLHAH